jgi:type II restriction enzyme
LNLELNPSLAEGYKSPSQISRVVTESWFHGNGYCPNCGNKNLEKFPNNMPVADFFCSNCEEQYELKSKKNSLGKKVNDGAYQTMLERISSTQNPSFFLLIYNRMTWRVKDFLVVPKHFFVPHMIERRNQLTSSADRVGWVGCNILVKNIPESGKIFLIQGGELVPKKSVLEKWQQTVFLRREKPQSKGWLIDVLNCLDKIPTTEFELQDVYAFEDELKELHPENRFVKDKIRQQLQFLRDKGLLEFTGRGKYKKLSLVTVRGYGQ